MDHDPASSFRPDPAARDPILRDRARQWWLVALMAALLLPAASAQDGAAGRTDGSTAARPPLPADAARDDAADDADDRPPAVDPRTRAARRLLRMRQGSVLRGSSRWNGDRWEYQLDGRWVALPPDAIESDRLESELLTLARKRRGAVPHNDAAGLAAHAVWLLDTGLYAEGLNTASEVLELDPDQPAILELLRSGTLPVAMPDLDVPAEEGPAARARMLDFAASAPRSLQELAIERLRAATREPEDVASLRDALDERLIDRSAATRAFAALALRRLVAPDVVAQAEVEEYLRRALRDVSPDVRRQASLALRDLHEEGLILPMLSALESPSAAMRTNAAEGLGMMAYSAAVPALVDRLVTLPLTGGSGGYRAPHSNVFVGRQIAYVAGFNVNVAQNAVIGDPEIGTLQEGASLDVSVLGVNATDQYLTESKALRTALTKLTGADPGRTKSAWKGWWVRNGDRWNAAAAVTGAGQPVNGQDPSAVPPTAPDAELPH